MLIFRRDSCPSDRRSCRPASVACSRPPTVAAGPVREREMDGVEKKEKERYEKWRHLWERIY